jgi:hypothetical protein
MTAMSPPRPAELLRSIRRAWVTAWAPVTTRSVARLAVLLLGWGLFQVMLWLGSAVQFSPYPGTFLEHLIGPVGVGLSVAFAVRVADYFSPPTKPALWTYCVAVALGSALGTLLNWPLFRMLGIPPDGVMVHVTGHGGFGWYQVRWGFWYFIVGVAFTGVYLSRRRASYRRTILRQTQVESARLQAQLADAKLRALQARIDVPSLIDELRAIERQFDADPQAAHRAMDALAGELRGLSAGGEGHVRA